MKIVVTGANGYLGQGIVTQLLNNGHEVIAADVSTERVDPRAELRPCNLFELTAPYESFGEPDVLLHLAWRDGFVHQSEAHMNDLPKHVRFLKNMIDSGVKRVAAMGSMHEIGFYEGCIREDTPCRPMNLYGISKNALCNTLQLFADQAGIPFQWLRGYYVVGNSPFGSSIFSKIAAAAAEGKTEFPFTMGQNQYDFIDYDSFCAQAAAAVGQDAVCGIINLCSGRPEKLADRVERFIRENGYEIRLNYGAYPDRPYDSKAVWGDSSRIERILAEKKYLGTCRKGKWELK